MKIAIHKTENDYPYRLLLQADETRESINKYLFDSEVYVVWLSQEKEEEKEEEEKEKEEPAGVFCLYRVDVSDELQLISSILHLY